MTSSPPGQNRHIPETTLRAALARFGIEEAVSIEPMEASKRNDNFIVRGTDGKYVFRRYRRNNDEARVRFQLRLQQHLLDSGFPTSEIVPSQTGESLVCEDSGLWSVFTYVEGSEFDFSRTTQVASAAQRLAQFHHVAATFHEPEVVFDANREWCDWWDDGDAAIAELASMFAGRGVDGDLAFLRDWYSEAIHDWPAARVERLPRGWIHGDWHGRNMVFGGDDWIHGVFDFDPMRRGVTVEDVARAIFMFGRESRLSRHIRLDVARVFLEDYDHIHELSAEELNALPFVMVAHLAPTVGYWRMLERDDEDAAAHLHHTVGLMQDLMPEAERLQHILDLSK
jgi:Ser/Thr protein kinase RdoA (MazF antagonist)